jgi:hypothetical protein
VYELVDTCGVYELVYVIYMCYLVACDRGRRQRRLCRVLPGQLRSATLGKIFPARVFPALPSVVARGARQRIFLKKN